MGKIVGSILANCCFIHASLLTICFITARYEWAEFNFKLKKTKEMFPSSFWLPLLGVDRPSSHGRDTLPSDSRQQVFIIHCSRGSKCIIEILNMNCLSMMGKYEADVKGLIDLKEVLEF